MPFSLFGNYNKKQLSDSNAKEWPELEQAWHGREIEMPNESQTTNSIRPMNIFERMISPKSDAVTYPNNTIALNRPNIENSKTNLSDVLVHELTHVGQKGIMRRFKDIGKSYYNQPDELAAIDAENNRKVRRNDIELPSQLKPIPSHFNTSIPSSLTPMASHSQLNPNSWDKRADGSQKGNGFLGALKRPDNSVSSEISISTDDFNKKEFPTIVPTLDKNELSFLLNMNVKKDKIPSSIIQKAVDFAKQRQNQGKPFFAQPGEEDYSIHPEYKRIQ